MSVSSPDALGVCPVRVALVTDDGDPPLMAKSTASGPESPEYSLSTTLPEVPAVSPGAVIEKVALFVVLEQFVRAYQPW